MSKAILISVKPKWVAKILNGEKTIEIRKTRPNCDLPIDVYIYCTKEETYWKYPYLNEKNVRKKYGICDWWGEYSKDTILINEGTPYEYKTYKCRGKVVAKFTFNKVHSFYYFDKDLLALACISQEEALKYMGKNEGYAWQIDDLEIFNEPKELKDFKKTNKFGVPQYEFGNETCDYKRMKKAPQSWCYIEVEE